MFVACGLNYKTAPLHIREEIAKSFTNTTPLLPQIMGLSSVNEAVILSTCNRTELYCETEEPESVVNWFQQQPLQQAPTLLSSSFFYNHNGPHGIKHALRVATGLDSMMLGEPQILGQMKKAYQEACDMGSIKTSLREAFQYIFSAAKRIRNQSEVGHSRVSIAYAAAQLVSNLFSDCSSLNAFLIGSGDTSTLVAKYLRKLGVKQFLIASRSKENAEQLAGFLNGEALTISDIPQHLAQADIVISATACPLPFISKSWVEQALFERKSSPMCFIDLSIPRDIEPEVGCLKGVSLYNLDDLQSLTEQGMNERYEAAIQAEQLVEFEVENYIRHDRSLRVNHIITDYRQHMQNLAQQELQRAREKLKTSHNEEMVLQEFCNRLVNKLIHHPTQGLRQAAWHDRAELLEFIKYLYSSPNTVSS